MPSVRTAPQAPYAAILGDAYAALHPIVRRAHEAPLTASGVMTVEHGRRWWTPLMVRAMRLPDAGPGQLVRLELSASGGTLIWSRQIGKSPLRTRQFAESGRLVECSGIGRVTFDLSVDDGTMLYQQDALEVAGLRVPRRISPRVQASVAAAADGWRVSVEVKWRGHLVCRYAGIIRPV